MAQSVGEIYYEVTLDTSKMIEEQRRVERKLSEIEARGKKFEATFSAIGGAIAAMFAADVIVAQLTAISQAAMQFEKALDNLSAITGATGAQLKFLENAAKEFGSSGMVSAIDAVEAMKLIASAKPELLENAAALKSVTEQAVILADASGMALPQAADSLTLALNQMGAGADQAGRFINVMAAGAKFGASEIGQSSEALKQFAVSARGVGLSIEEANAGIQALAAVGIKGSEAGVALRNILLKLETETNGKLKPSINGLAGSLENLGRKNLDTAALTKMFGLENINATNALLGSTDQIKILTAQLTGTQTAVDQAKTNTDNYAGSVKNMNAALEAAYITVGEKLLPVLRSGADLVTKIASEIADGSDRIDAALTAISTAAIMAGGAVSGMLIASLRQAVVGMTAATVAANVFGGALSLMGGPIGIAITALGLLVINWDKIAGSAESAAQISENAAARIAAVQGKSTAKASSDLLKQLTDAKSNLSKTEQELADATRKSIYGDRGTVSPQKDIDDITKRRDAYVQAISDITKAMNGLGGGAGRGAINPELVSPKENKPKLSTLDGKSSSKSLDAQAYYQGLVAENKTALEKIDAEEQKALTENQKRRNDDGANAAIYEKAKLEIQRKFATERALLEEKTTQGVADLNIQITTDEWTKIEAIRAEAIRRADAAVALGTMSHGEAERAKTLATFTAEQQRAEISERTAQTVADINIEAATDELTKIDLIRQESFRRADAAVKAGVVSFAQGEADKAKAAQQAQNSIRDQVMSINPMAKLAQEYEQKLAIVRYYEQQMAQAGIDASTFAEGKRAELQQQFTLQRQALLESEFAMQSNGNKFLIDGLNNLSTTAASSISGLIQGTMTAQDALRGLASVVLNEAVGALVQIGMQYVKNALIGAAAEKGLMAVKAANAAVYTTAVAAQVAVTSSLAAAAAFASTAAIPIVGPGLAPAAAAAAATAVGALGSPAIAAAPVAGARQYGGPVSASNLYRINEKGAPEMFTAANGNQYMMPTTSGRVTAADQVGGGMSVNIVVNNTAPGTTATASFDDQSRTVTIAVAEVAAQIRSNTGVTWAALRAGSDIQPRMG